MEPPPPEPPPPDAPDAPRLWAAAAALAVLAAALTPGLAARLLSPDGDLAPHVRLGLQWARAAAGLAAAGLAAWAPLGRARRQALRASAEAALRHPAFGPLAAAAAAALLATELRVYEWDPFSEGIFLYGARRTALGEVPCRDFFTYVPPGWFYALGGIFRLFGASLSAARLAAGVLPKLAATLLLYSAARALCGRAWAPALAALCLLALSPNPNEAEVHPAPLALALALATVPLLARRGRRGELAAAAAAGAAAAAAGWVRQDFGLYALLANAACLLLDRRGRPAAAAAAYAAGWAAGVLPAAGAFAAAVPAQALRECYLEGPAAYLSRLSTRGAQTHPFHALLALASGASPASALRLALLADLPPFLCLLGAAAGLRRLLRERRAGPLGDRALLGAHLTAWCAAFLGYAMKGGARPFTGALPAALLLLGREAALASAGAGAAWRAAAAGYGALLFVLRPLAPPAGAAAAATAAGPALCRTEAEALELGSLLNALEGLPAGAKIFVFNRAKSGNPVALYFLSGRPSATRYHELFPGVADRPEALARLARELADPSVAAAVEAPSPSREGPPDEADRALDELFAPASRHGRYILHRRKPPARP